MFVVTTIAERTPAGCLVGFTTQCGVDPPRYLVCLSDKNFTCRVAQHAEVLAVHFLSADAHDLARRFGSETGDDTDKFTGCEWHPGPRGVPIVDSCERWFVGAILERFSVGDHVGHLLEPIEVQNGGDGELMGFQQTKDLEPGHEA
jgi:flavin reductase (DIM6/NTAB) family NADH-FMN oxidoreductase RutF